MPGFGGFGPKLLIQILADASQAQKEVRATAGKLEQGFGSALVPALGVLGVLGGLGAAAASAASDTEQSFGALDTVFKGTADQAKTLATDASAAVGLAASEYAKLASILGSQLKGMGVASDQLLPKTDDLIKLGADLSATFGGTTAEAVSAISALLRGERDPIERYGVSLKQVDIDAQLAADGVVTAAKASKDLARAHAATTKAQAALTKAQKSGDPAAIKAAQANLDTAKAAETAAGAVKGLDSTQLKAASAQAALTLLTQDTADAQGQFARESDTAAHAQQVMQAEMANAASTIGTALLPLVVFLADALATAAKWIGENADLVRTLAVVVGILAGAIVAVNLAIAAYQAITVLATAAQWLLNAALAANPIGIIVIAVIALVAALILLWQNSETFRTIVTDAFKTVQAVVQTVVGAIIGFFTNLVATVRSIFAPVAQILSGPIREFRALVASVVALVQALFRVAVSVISGLMRQLGGILAGPFNTLLTLVGNVMGGIQTAIASAVAIIRGIWGPVSGVLAGPFNTLLSVVKTVFGKVRDIAQSAADFIAGLFRKIRGVVDSITGALNAIPHGLIVSVPAPAGVAGPSTYRARAGTSAALGGRTDITFVLDGHVFGRATIGALRDYDRRNGTAQVIPRWS